MKNLIFVNGVKKSHTFIKHLRLAPFTTLCQRRLSLAIICLFFEIDL
jgi:hypothetical protein